MTRIHVRRHSIRPVITLEIQVEVTAGVDAKTGIHTSLRTVTSQVSKPANKWAPVRTGLTRNNSIQRPAAEYMSDHSLLRSQPWELPNVSRNQALANIEDRVPAIQLWNLDVRSVTLTRGRSI